MCMPELFIFRHEVLGSQGAAMHHWQLPGHYDLLGHRGRIPRLNYLPNWPPKMYECTSNVRVEVNIGLNRVTQLTKPHRCGSVWWVGSMFWGTAAGWHWNATPHDGKLGNSIWIWIQLDTSKQHIVDCHV